MKPLYAESVAFVAPGLDGWDAAAPVLRGELPYAPAELPVFQPQLLPANERRRATAAVRLAFRTAEDALARSSLRAADLATVFASSEADTHVIHRICTALAADNRVVSPTDFHNSVHNAAAGYWSIAVGARGPSTSIAAWDASFAAGLCEAAALAHGDAVDVLLAAYDVRPPGPIHAVRPIDQPAGAALVLTREPTERSLGRLILRLTARKPDNRMLDPALETLRRANPAARALPLLRLVARAAAGRLCLEAAVGRSLELDYAPC